MNDEPLEIMMVVGEASGDHHGAKLIESLRDELPPFEIFGLGGENMREQGVETLYGVEEMGAVGITEIIPRLPFFWKVYRELVEEAKKRNPDFVILVDYPGFNIRLASKLKKVLETKIIYYISPQVWAWRRRRARKIARVVDLMLVFFPFEKEIYEEEGVDTVFVGHPFSRIADNIEGKKEFFSNNNLNPDKKTLGFLPGSRTKEVKSLLPTMVKCIPEIRQYYPQIVVSNAGTVDRKVIENIVDEESVVITGDNIYNLLNCVDAGVVVSGTVSLQAALMLTPSIVVYRLSFVTYLLARMFVGVDYTAMANIIADREVLPELIQNEYTVSNVIEELEKIATSESVRNNMIEGMKEVKDKIGKGDAARRAADAINQLVRLQ